MAIHQEGSAAPDCQRVEVRNGEIGYRLGRQSLAWLREDGLHLASQCRSSLVDMLLGYHLHASLRTRDLQIEGERKS